MSGTLKLPVLGQWSDIQTEVEAKPVKAAPLQTFRLEPGQIHHYGGNCYTHVVPVSLFSNLPAEAGELAVTVLEDNQILGPSVPSHALIRRWGEGGFNLWYNPGAGHERGAAQIYFSTSDNSDPRTNGRTYTLVNQPLGFANDWQYFQVRRWLNHSRGRYFLRRGGDRIPPPLTASMGITDICNLKCGICGSQNMLQPVNRRHMDFHIFERVAETLFPLLITLEFNSRGEPLLHPKIADMFEIIADYGVFTRVQTNGTQFVDRKLRTLCKISGEVSISIDATGDLFEYARTGGKWAQVDEGVRRFMKMRDRDRLAVHLYPTLTQATAEGAEDLIRWAMEVGVDKIDFHQYDPIEQSHERMPTSAQLDRIKRFAATHDAGHPIEIRLNYEVVKQGEAPLLRRPVQERYSNIPRPKGSGGAHPVYRCMAPVQNVDLDLDGCVGVCCQLQDRKLGNAHTPEAFADCWFGAEYETVRRSLMRTSPMALYETCRGCVGRYAPGE